MNEKFKQFSLAAGGSHYPTINPQLQQRFAELIVQECIAIAEDTRFDGKVVAARIRFAFGLDNE
jgi:hypothetical protein